ncbi:unnamed protein product [Heterobilharzia americana]|nr:unnamed protein product [Heterobilharzia americana]
MATIDMAKSTPSVVNIHNKQKTADNRRIHQEPYKLNIEKTDYSSFQATLQNLDLNHLSEDERQKVLDVIKNDFLIRAKERERLNILRRDKELAAKNLLMVVESTSCLLCGRAFMALFNPKRICANCQRTICRNCSDSVPKFNGYFCTLCLKETGYRAMTCNWFYDTVIQRFREFGSTTVAKSLFGSKYKQVQNMAEDELCNLLFRFPSSKRNSLDSSESAKPFTSDQAREAQISKLRSRLRKLMDETQSELNAIEKYAALSPRQITWQYENIYVKFKKNSCREMKSFIQILYIMTEKQHMSQGMSTKNITPYVMDILEDEISQLVGYSVKGITDTNSLAGEDDKESVSMVESEAVEERLAEVLLNKIRSDLDPGKQISPIAITATTAAAPVVTNLKDSSNVNEIKPDNYLKTFSNNTKEEVSAIEGFPIRIEYDLPYEEQCEFRWYKLNNEKQRVPVKLDFRIEHVITGVTSNPLRKHTFVLSNSGSISNETKQKLCQLKRELLELSVNRGNNNNNNNSIIQLQHHLIIWASKLDDAGHYFATVQYPLNVHGTSAITEKEYILQILRGTRSPSEAQQQPVFIEPLTVQSISCDNNDQCIEMTCVVTGNPSPRCLFYRNSVPIPVVIMPLTKVDSKQPLSTINSFSQKYAIISSLCSVDNTKSYVRKITLRINRPSSSEDIATYSCRAWNCHGRTITTTDVSLVDHFSKFDCPPGKKSVYEKVNLTKFESINLAANISQTADEHGDFLVQKEDFPHTTARSGSFDRYAASVRATELSRNDQNTSNSVNDLPTQNQLAENMKVSDLTKTINHIQSKVAEPSSSSPRRNMPQIIRAYSHEPKTETNIYSEVNNKSKIIEISPPSASAAARNRDLFKTEENSFQRHQSMSNVVENDDISSSSSSSISTIGINRQSKQRRSSVKLAGPNVLIDRRSNRNSRRNSSSSNITDK